MTDTRSAASVIRDVLAATDAKDTASLAELFTADVRVTFGNAGPILGKEAVFTAENPILDAVSGLRHENTSCGPSIRTQWWCR